MLFVAMLLCDIYANCADIMQVVLLFCKLWHFTIYAVLSQMTFVSRNTRFNRHFWVCYQALNTFNDVWRMGGNGCWGPCIQNPPIASLQCSLSLSERRSPSTLRSGGKSFQRSIGLAGRFLSYHILWRKIHVCIHEIAGHMGGCYPKRIGHWPCWSASIQSSAGDTCTIQVITQSI